MKKLALVSLVFIGCIIFFTSCDKNDYLIGGELHNPVVNMTTYDYMKSNRFGLFDTLLLLVDKAGIKDKINQNGTFFAPTNYAINKYLNRRSLIYQRIDPYYVWTIDSLIKYELPNFVDSMDIYFLKDVVLPNSELIAKGTIFKNLKNEDVVVSYEETSNPLLGFSDYSSIKPRIVYFTRLYQSLPTDFKVQEIFFPVGERTLVQTSNIQTTNGVLHVLGNSHILFYYR